MMPWLANFVPEESVKAILFDLDNTLIDRDGAFEACLRKVFPEQSVRQELLSLDQGGHGCRETLFEAWSRKSGELMSQQKFVQLLTEQLSPDSQQKHRLQELSKRYKLGIVSNGGGGSQRRKLQATELDQIFPSERTFISGELGVAKPDPRIFHHACEVLGEDPKDCLFIGDQEQIDGLGARRAGLRYLGCGQS